MQRKLAVTGRPFRLSPRSLCENTVTSVGSAPASFTLWRWRRADEPIAETELLCEYQKKGKNSLLDNDNNRLTVPRCF